MGKQDPMIGRVLHGTIELRRLIGAGGMGNVYEGYQEHLDRVVAVKVLSPEHARNPVAGHYFLREARAASGLRHPNLIQIIDYGEEDDGTLFLAMEYVPGKPLGKILRHEFPLETERVVNVLDQTLAGLGEAHRKEIIHRDLKPDNLMIETIDGRDFVKVLDFGIAQSRAPERKVGPLTRQGAVVGTPQYMAPEQAAGEAVDARSDLFSLGVILYEMLTRKAPFTGKNLPEILIAVMKTTPQPPSAAAPGVTIDPTLEMICLRALKKDPDLRYQSADEFREALRVVGSSAAAPRPQEKAPPAQFVFRRAKSARRATPTEPVESEPDAAPTERQPSAIESAETQMQIAPKTEPAHAARPHKLGFDVEELRGDLLGERVRVVSLVSHQRSAVRIDAEELLELRGALDAAHQSVATRWGGKVHGRQGGFVTILFGIDAAGGDEGMRGAQAAIQLRRELGRISPAGTAFSFALGEGEVFCPDGKISNAAGAPIDEATEACRSAGDGSILVVGESFGLRLDPFFRLDKLGGDGHRALLGVRDATALNERVDEKFGELVGRDHEIATILGLLGRLSQGKGSILPIVGEGGVGKTSLLREVTRLADQRGFRVVRARARWRGAELLRWIRTRWLVDILRQQGRSLRDADVAFRELGVQPEARRLLCALLDDRLDEAIGFRGEARGADLEADIEANLRVAFREVARALAEDRPTVFVIDDLDGFDGVFAETMRGWDDLVDTTPVLLALGIRSGPGQSLDSFGESATRLDVPPLDSSSARALVKVLLAGTGSDQMLDRLVRVGGGIPLHLEHLVRHARTTESADDAEVADWLASARSVQELLELRLFAQPRALQNVMALLAGLGAGVAGDVVLDLASPEWEPERALETLYEQGLVELEGEEENPRVHLRPPALQSVVYGQLSRKMRARIHGRAATYFDERVHAGQPDPAREDLAALARHLELSGEPEKALEPLDALIDRAMRRFEFELAREHLLDAVRVLHLGSEPDRERLARYELQLVRAEVATGRRRDALDRCLKLERTKDLRRRTAAEIKIQLAELWLEQEDPDLVEKIVRGTLGEIRKMQIERPDDVELRCLLIRALQQMASTHEKAGRLVPAAKFALEGAELIERGELDALSNPWGPSLVWEILNQLGRIRLRTGELDGARRMFELALRVVNDADDPRGEVAVRANLSALLAHEGALDDAYQSLSSALRTARRLSDARAIARLEHNRGLLLVRQKRMQMASEAFEESLRLSNDLDWREGIAMNADRLRFVREQMGEGERDEFMRPIKR